MSREPQSRKTMLGIDPTTPRVHGLLTFLVLFDLVLVIWAGVFPELWFTAFHGVPYVDPQGFLRRCAANWAAFLLMARPTAPSPQLYEASARCQSPCSS